jgi:ubiquinone/menaquinone biosynthesis C-methylase UbiE
MVDPACPMHNFLSKKFKKDVTETWEYLWGFPLVRDYFAHSPLPDTFIALDKLEISFNSEYKWAMQSRYKTNCPDLTPFIKGTVLEVGAGDGSRVKALRDKGISATGIEVNDAQVNELVGHGDAEYIPFGNDTFGTVYSVDVLEHLDHPHKALSEMFRVSKGTVINAITPCEDPCFVQDPTHKVEWDKERWKREIDQFGEITDVLEPFTVVAKKRRE